MKKRCQSIFTLLLFTCVLFFVCACSQSQDTPGKIADVDFTVVSPDDVPKELSDIIESHKQEEIKMTYIGNDSLYLVRGYGEQKTGGYSITADSFYLAEDGLHLATTLIGPSQETKTSADPSYPILILKTEKREETVTFD